MERKSDKLITVGICVMDKKALSSPMMEILNRLRAFGEFEIINFGDDMILNKPIEEWPLSDWLITFYSTGFPLEKAEQYVALRKPYLVNQLTHQRILNDRRLVFQTLKDSGIPTPRHVIVSRDKPEGEDTDGFIERDDAIEVNTATMNKPFVEKPVDANNHNVRIYYPSSAGGGMKELFRKVGNRSSEFHENVRSVRMEGSYIYEEFMATGGTDVKVYTVGPDYAHAEARKSPVVDGVVMRNPDGKEIRYPVLLTPLEKAYARAICLAFGQSVCGFDLLRCNGKSYVCDVNGWSFVKNSHKYYDDAALVLRSMLLGIVTPDLSTPVKNLPWGSPVLHGEKSPAIERTPSNLSGRFNQGKELRSVISIIRHGDRTPKQKVKFKTKNDKLLNLMLRFNGNRPRSEAKLKSALQLEALLEVCKKLVPAHRPGRESDSEAEDYDNTDKLRHIKTVLEEGGHFSGIYRKVQIKPLAWTKSISEEGNLGEETEKPVEAMMVLKYGGVLTHAGHKQAEEQGRIFRNTMYPGEGTGLLRLHSTYRHDLKIYSSDEGRVQMSAAAFAKGLLDLEGQLTPILVSLVSKDSPMLDALSDPANREMDAAKVALLEIIKSTGQASPALQPATKSDLPWMADGAGMPPDALARLHELVALLKAMTAQLKDMKCRADEEGEETDDVDAEMPPYHEARGLGNTEIDRERIKAGLPCGTEGFNLMFARWKKLERDLYNEKKDSFDISKVPDIYDSAKYDLLHNRHLKLDGLEQVYTVCKELADGVIPNEYGINPHQKLHIGAKVARRLLGKVLIDMRNTREETLSYSAEQLPAKCSHMAQKGSKKDMSKHGGSASVDSLHHESGSSALLSHTLSDSSQSEKEDDMDKDKEPQYRLDPKYANVRTPQRHVRTRLYFTSESHIHSVLNVLRYCHLDDALAEKEPLVSKQGLEALFRIPELDYLTHIVFLMYEDPEIPLCDPRHFQIEVLLSAGAAYSPLNVVEPCANHHMLPVLPPEQLQRDTILTLEHLEEMLRPFAMPAEDFPPPATPHGFSSFIFKGGSSSLFERMAQLWPFHRGQSMNNLGGPSTNSSS